MTDELPEVPSGYFWRIKEGWFFGPTVVVELRQRFRFLPWSIKCSKGWSTREIMEVDTDREVAILIARNLARELAGTFRGHVELGDLAGDHPMVTKE